MAESPVRALAKVVQVMPVRLRRRVDALRAMTVPAAWGSGVAAGGVDPAVLTTVALACRDTERVEFGYTAADGRRSERTVQPFRLVSLGRRWYLVAYDLGRGHWRSFRLDRLQRPRGTGVRFGPRRFPAEDAAAFVRDSIGGLPATYVVEALVRGPADEVRQRIGRWATVDDDGGTEGRCRVVMESDNLDWPAAALAVAGVDFTAVSPAEFRDRLRDLSRRFAEAAGGSPSPAPPGDRAVPAGDRAVRAGGRPSSPART